jgi:hypothetical protein
MLLGLSTPGSHLGLILSRQVELLDTPGDREIQFCSDACDWANAVGVVPGCRDPDTRTGGQAIASQKQPPQQGSPGRICPQRGIIQPRQIDGEFTWGTSKMQPPARLRVRQYLLTDAPGQASQRRRKMRVIRSVAPPGKGDEEG